MLKIHPRLFTIAFILWTLCTLFLTVVLVAIMYYERRSLIANYGSWKFQTSFSVVSSLLFIICNTLYLILFYVSVFQRHTDYRAERHVLSPIAWAATLIEVCYILIYGDFYRALGPCFLIVLLQLILYFGQENYFAQRLNLRR